MKAQIDFKAYASADQSITEGWGWPGISKKAHWFTEDGRSLCGKWMYMGSLETGNDASADNCAECKRRLAKRHN